MWTEVIILFLNILTDKIFWFKWLAAYCALRIKNRTQRRRFDLYDFHQDTQAEKLGIVIPEQEKTLETPLSDANLKEATDEVFLYGVNSKSECLVVRIARECNVKAQAWIYLKLSNGHRYQLQTDSDYQRGCGDKCQIFSCGGLQMYYLSPMRKWRIVYCGMLRELNQREKSEAKEVFVKFSFIWTASSDVYDGTSDFNTRAAALAMYRTVWETCYPPVDKMKESLNFYSQSGFMNGVVSVEDQPDTEMHLFGERIRNLAKRSNYMESNCVFGVTPKNGLVFHFDRASISSACTNIPCGFVVLPSGIMLTVDEGLIREGGAPNVLETVITTFSAGYKYDFVGKISGDAIFCSKVDQDYYLKLYEMTFEIGSFKGSGFYVTRFLRYSDDLPEVSKREEKIIPTMCPKSRPLIASFTDPISHFIEVSGGKGSSLGRLTELSDRLKSFVVPKGIAVTTAAYSEFLTTEIIEKIENLKDIAYGNTEGDILEACKIVSSAIERTQLPRNVKAVIEEKLKDLFDDNIDQHKFAVRSSATGEDTDQMSAAGQMDTFLGVQGLEKILTAVKKCWASQFGHVAVQYKRQNGQILNSPMAVVIQEMVNCEAAGVLFTCDPVTSNPSVIFITGNYGLGESVVSGTEEPDTVVLKRTSNNTVELQSVTVGLKQHKIIMAGTKTSDGKETILKDVPEDKRKECCISKEMAEKLGTLSLEIEDYYKSPRDIEWGVKDNTIYILQSRPVTTGEATTDYEIMHEFDGPIRCEGEYFTVCNAGEVFPGATSPLGFDVCSKHYIVVERRVFNPYKCAYYPGMLLFCNHAMLPVGALLTHPDDTTIYTQCASVGVFGRIIEEPEMNDFLKYRAMRRPKPSILQCIKYFWTLFFSRYNTKSLQDKIFSYESSYEKCKTSFETFEAIMKSRGHLLEPFVHHIQASSKSSACNAFMLVTLGQAKGSIDAEVYSDFAKLLSAALNVESADVPAAMQDLAHSIVQDMKVRSFKSMDVKDARDWLEKSTTTAGHKYRQFMNRHGHRCLKEFDVYSIPWNTEPETLIKLLQNLAESSSDVKQEKNDSTKILSELKVPLNWKSRFLLKCILPNCHGGIRARETCKSVLIKAMDDTRKGFLHLAKRMVAEGFLPEKDLIFFMTINEIQEHLQTRNPKFIARANHRRKLFPLLESMIFPEISKGYPAPINMDNKDEEYIADLTMKGTPVSQGTVKGYARVAVTLNEAAKLKPGEILITYCTDIGWSPYFPILSGVVTEIGGLISHGAVISREYGLPCVVGLHGATRKFVTGDYVLLDGNRGILQRLTAPEK